MPRKKKKMNRKVAKVKGFKSVPKKYVSGLKRTARAKDIAKMQRLYKAGKKVPRSLFKRVFS